MSEHAAMVRTPAINQMFSNSEQVNTTSVTYTRNPQRDATPIISLLVLQARGAKAIRGNQAETAQPGQQNRNLFIHPPFQGLSLRILRLSLLVTKTATRMEAFHDCYTANASIVHDPLYPIPFFLCMFKLIPSTGVE
jgi:hypothetical protein